MLLPNKESGAHWMNSNKNFFHQINPQKSLSAANPTFEKECPGISSRKCDDYARESITENVRIWVLKSLGQHESGAH